MTTIAKLFNLNSLSMINNIKAIGASSCYLPEQGRKGDSFNHDTLFTPSFHQDIIKIQS